MLLHPRYEFEVFGICICECDPNGMGSLKIFLNVANISTRNSHKYGMIHIQRGKEFIVGVSDSKLVSTDFIRRG